jgi:arginyl-tRNA synthetase
MHFQQVFSIARRWNVKSELIHCWFGLMSMPNGAIGTRQGNAIRLIDLLDEAKRRARLIVDAKNKDLTEEERDEIAEAIGVSAVRYADLSQNPQTNVTFDWDRMLSLEGNTAPYLMYAHVRCVQVLAKAASDADVWLMGWKTKEERALVMAIARFPYHVQVALRSMSPNVVCQSLWAIAKAFNAFYHKHPILEGGDRRDARLALVELTRAHLRFGMELLGLSVLHRM